MPLFLINAEASGKNLPIRTFDAKNIFSRSPACSFTCIGKCRLAVLLQIFERIGEGFSMYKKPTDKLNF